MSLRPSPGEEDPREIRGSTIGFHDSALVDQGTEPPPEYIAKATEPSAEAWAHEEELYRQKDESEPEPPSGS